VNFRNAVITVEHASGQNVPVWVIPIGQKSLNYVQHLVKAWMQAEEFIRLRKKAWKKSDDGENRDEIMQRLRHAFLHPMVRNIREFDHNEPLYKLATYREHAWFATAHENQILDSCVVTSLLQGLKIEMRTWPFFLACVKLAPMRHG